MCYIIFDKNYTNEKHLKTQFIHIFFIKYYITKIKILKIKVKRERLKKSKLDNNFETEGVLNLDRIHLTILDSQHKKITKI